MFSRPLTSCALRSRNPFYVARGRLPPSVFTRFLVLSYCRNNGRSDGVSLSVHGVQDTFYGEKLGFLLWHHRRKEVPAAGTTGLLVKSTFSAILGA